MMARAGIIILFLCKICSAQAVGNPEPLVVSVKVGESVTINCTIKGQKSKAMFWFKQRLEHMPLEVGFKHSTKDPELQNQFRDSKSGFQLNQTASGVSLIIKSVSKEDEGMYFCGEAEQSTVNFSNGTFLAVSGHSNISVDQTPVLESVSSGESVTLQCTVLSEIHSEDLRVLWFRSAAGRSFPEIIYTDHNSSSSRQCETSSSPHSCVYNFSKNILNDSDAGTYYCAVTTCGKIIIGNGTTVCLNPPDSPLLMALVVSSVVCVVVICAQAVVIVKIRRSGQHTEKLRQGAVIENASNQDGNAESLNYAAVQFKEKKPKREDRRRREEPEELVYSQVRTSTATGPRPKR